MNELKPEDVMRALELHADCETDNCFECPYAKYLSKADGNCVHHLSMDALALLREKDALIADYIRQIAEMQAQIATQDSELTELMKCKHIEADKDAEIERLTEENKSLRDNTEVIIEMVTIARAEAITEFAERLKRFYSNLNGKTVGGSVEYHIDQIAKEMKGEQK